MTDEDCQHVADLPTANPRAVRCERVTRLSAMRGSVWFPIIIGVVVWQWTGLVFGPMQALSRGDWTWILGFYMAAYSVLPAQICLLNLGLLFGPGTFRQRALVYWLISIVLLVTWYLWLAFANRFSAQTPYIDGDFAAMGVWLPVYVLTLQLPSLCLWWWRWQFVNAKLVDQPAPRRGSFSIRDLMIATAVVAVTLVWYRWLWQRGGGQTISLGGDGWLLTWCNALGIAISIVPLTWAWLAIRNVSYVVGWCFSVVYSVYVVAIGCTIHYCVDEFPLDAIPRLIAPMTLGFTLPMIVGLHLLRAFGWRLERRRK